MVYGQCEKVFILFPPTANNLEGFASTAGLKEGILAISPGMTLLLLLFLTAIAIAHRERVAWSE